jgi:hypothetical protein
MRKIYDRVFKEKAVQLSSLHTTETLEFYVPDYSTALKLPFIDVGISAGFPSPAAATPWNLLLTSDTNISDITIYPTVTNDIFHLNNTTNHTYHYAIYHPIGQQVCSKSTSDVIAISNNRKGVYCIKLQFENQSKTFKVILNY